MIRGVINPVNDLLRNLGRGGGEKGVVSFNTVESNLCPGKGIISCHVK